jgi:hypothetical protein
MQVQGKSSLLNVVLYDQPLNQYSLPPISKTKSPELRRSHRNIRNQQMLQHFSDLEIASENNFRLFLFARTLGV